jgi:hypothetical protein
MASGLKAPPEEGSAGLRLARKARPALLGVSMSTAAVSTPAASDQPAHSALLLGALGVVFGDIGTSPIYAFRESLKATSGPGAETTVLGILSLVVWAITLVVAIKYVLVVMRPTWSGGPTSEREEASAPRWRAGAFNGWRPVKKGAADLDSGPSVPEKPHV